MAPADCAPSTSTGTPLSRRSSSTGKRLPVIQHTCERAISRVLGVTASSSTGSDSSGASSRTGTTRTCAVDAASAPSSPKCSPSVVTTSSSGPS